MALGDLSAESVKRAIAEFDELGRAAFLKKYRFGQATEYALMHEGREYDPKAIAGVAYGFDHPDEGPLPNTQFNGGKELQKAYGPNFAVVKKATADTASIRALLKRILDDYPAARQGTFSGTGDVPTTFRELRAVLTNTDALATRQDVVVKPSFGQGNWARVPWIALLDPRETTTTQRGVYPVILFREDMSGLYVTVAQGVTEPRAAGRAELERHLKETAEAVRRTVPAAMLDRNFQFDSRIDLRSKGDLARNYELSVIAHKFYEGGALPSDDDIVSDLEAALQTVDRFIEHKATTVDAVPIATLEEAATGFRAAVDASGLRIPDGPGDRVAGLVAALVTKPFVILSGLSGSGKTQLALRLGEWCGVGPTGPRLEVVPVRPDWTGPESLFGYEDALRPAREGRAAWFVPPTLRFLLRAAAEPELPHVLLLDEMNLAHVERYFSDFLSGVESREPVMPNLQDEEDGEWREAPEGPPRLPIPRNLFVVGTVNVDETTYQFSPKVLDRAMTFEIRTSTTELDEALRRPMPAPQGDESLLRALVTATIDDDWHVRDPAPYTASVAGALRNLHEGLQLTGDEFGHRVFYESLRLTTALHRVGVRGADAALDAIVLLKVLPRVHGSRRRAEPVLKRLLAFAHDPHAPIGEQPPLVLEGQPRLQLTARKVNRMLRTVEVNQFVSFTD
jgi:5-methylcytosine-specific restriction protein B